MKNQKHELVIPTWPNASGWAYFGGTDYTSYTDDTTSFWLSLRAVKEGDKYPYFDEGVRAVNDMGLYCYVCTDGTVSIDIRTKDGGHQTLREAELAVKTLKRLIAKASKSYPVGNFIRGGDIHTELTKVLASLGIQRSIQYRGINVDETYDPVGIAVARIAEIINKKLGSLTQRKAA